MRAKAVELRSENMLDGLLRNTAFKSSVNYEKINSTI